jgi:hypothetical protein
VKTVTHADETQLNYDTTRIVRKLEHSDKSSSKDLSAFIISHCGRRELPYGIWTCADTSEVVFNREYQPIICRKDGVCTYDDKNRWVGNIVSAVYLYNDWTSPMNILTKHLGQSAINAKQTKECKKSLLICIDVLQNFTPTEHGSVNSEYSIKQL